MRLNVWRVIAFFLLIALSVGFGFAFDAVATAIERGQHPRPAHLATSVAENAEAYGIPETVLWAVMKTESRFVGDKVSDDGAIGLMQLTAAQFNFISTQLLEEVDANASMLYAPDFNLRAGSAYISYLYSRYGVWDHVFAAYRAGTDTVDAWLAQPDLVSEQGVLTDIPDKPVAEYVENVKKAVESYTKLYYQAT